MTATKYYLCRKASNNVITAKLHDNIASCVVNQVAVLPIAGIAIRCASNGVSFTTTSARAFNSSKALNVRLIIFTSSNRAGHCLALEQATYHCRLIRSSPRFTVLFDRRVGAFSVSSPNLTHPGYRRAMRLVHYNVKQINK